MKRVAAAVLGALLSASIAAATGAPSCCVCSQSERAQTGGFEQPSQQLVFFCAEAGPGDVEALVARCAARSEGATLGCETNIPGPSCSQQLADAGFACPAAGVPAAGPLPLATLAIALAALGTAVVSRRRGRDAGAKGQP